MKILVTGGAGLIGSHLCNALLDQGHEVVSVDDLSKGKIEHHRYAQDFKNFSFVKADVCSDSFLTDIKGEFDVVAHLAAAKIPRYGGRLDTLWVNGVGSINALQLAARCKAKAVMASTSDVYGRNEKAPLREDDQMIFPGPEVARWSYAVSKYHEEHLAFGFQERHGIPVVCMRFFATYGPHQALSWTGGPTPVFIEKAIKGEPVTIHGDGSQRRCFCYVSDTVDGIVRCIENEKANGEIFNIGNPTDLTILEFAHLVYGVVRPQEKTPIEWVPYETFGKYEDIKRRQPDISKIKNLLGFAPKVDLKDGIAKTLDWQRQFYKL